MGMPDGRVLLSLPMTHCVDDMIVVEPSEWIMSAWRCWKRMNICMGWDVSEEKNPNAQARVPSYRCRAGCE